jgi:hypothetical protein
MSPEVTEGAAKFVETIWQDGFEHGHDEGYQKGWDAATAAMIEAASSKRAPMQPELKLEPKVHRERTHLLQPTAEVTPQTSRDLIATALLNKPGMRPTELARWAAQEHGSNEKTILTQIKRMRKRGEFEKRNDSQLFLKTAAAK